MKNTHRKMLITWMMKSDDKTLSRLLESKQSAYSFWAYYTHYDRVKRDGVYVTMPRAERTALRQAVKEEVGTKTFAELLKAHAENS